MRIDTLLKTATDDKTLALIFNHMIKSSAKISFSQHGEDRIIYPHITENYRPAGTYVDFGAHHPTRFSNSYLLYLAGWRGITVEANPDLHPLFEEVRPGDTHLSVAVGSAPGKAIYRRYQEPAYNKIIALGEEDAPDDAGVPKTDESLVVLLPPNEILKKLPLDRRFDLLTVDIEGLDESVLRAIDFRLFRPKLLCVELLLERAQSDEFQSWLRSIRYKNFCQCFNSFMAVPEEG